MGEHPSVGLAWLDAAEGAAWDPHIDIEAGRLFESGMVWGLRTLGPFLLGGGKLAQGLEDCKTLVKAGGDLFEQLDAFRSFETDRMRFLHAAKFLADGAFIAQLMQMGPPGYIDGHDGAWLSDPDQLYLLIKPFWDHHYNINIHTNGDRGVTACLDVVDRLLREAPRFDHRTTLYHFGMSTQAQARRLGNLGVAVQANGYYLHLFGDALSIAGWEPNAHRR